MAEKLTREEVIEKIKEQVQLLQVGAEQFDQGVFVISLYIATTIRVLFHDTNESVSLIKQLCDIDGLDKNAFKMITTKKQYEEGTLVLLGDELYSFSMGSKGFMCVPKFNDSTVTTVPFCDWWSEKVVKNVEKGYEEPIWLSRKEIITLHANKEGGTHVDQKKNNKIYSLNQKEAFGFTSYYINQEGEEIEQEMKINHKKATIRQICYEVLISLYTFCPDLFLTEYADPFKKATVYY